MNESLLLRSYLFVIDVLSTKTIQHVINNIKLVVIYYLVSNLITEISIGVERWSISLSWEQWHLIQVKDNAHMRLTIDRISDPSHEVLMWHLMVISALRLALLSSLLAAKGSLIPLYTCLSVILLITPLNLAWECITIEGNDKSYLTLPCFITIKKNL